MSEPESAADGTRKSPPRPEPGVGGPAATGELFPAPAPVLPAVPQHIGRYEVKQLLGAGTFGRVFLGYDPTVLREVAIKQPFGQGLAPGPLASFLKEARATAKIHHENVCPVYDAGTDGEVPYLVMRFVHGGTLAGLLEPGRPPLTLQNKVAIARKLALGLAAAHEQGVVHRDLKPANVLSDRAKRQVLIADFGLAHVVEHQGAASTGGVKGTPAYMSPEQWSSGKPHPVGPLSDLYSLGVILYEMLAGRVPFTGTVFELMLLHCQTPPAPPSAAQPGLDPQLDAICLKALAKNPGNRYGSAKEFAGVLSDYLRTSEPPGAARAPEPAEEPAPPEVKPPPPAPAVGASRSPTREEEPAPAEDAPPPRRRGRAGRTARSRWSRPRRPPRRPKRGGRRPSKRCPTGGTRRA